MRELWTLLADFVILHWQALDALLVVSGLVIYVAASHSLNQRRHPSAAIAWVMGGVVDVEPLVSHTLPLDEFPKGLADFEAGRTLKVHLVP